MGEPASDAPRIPLHSKVPDLPQRASHQQSVPIADDFDLPPPYEASVSGAPAARSRSNRSSTSSIAHPHDGLLGSQPQASAPSAPYANVNTKGYDRTDPMVWAEMERSGKWDKHNGEAGACGSTTGGCCFSHRGGCCFSDREACCFSDRQACCFSDRGACCFSDTAGCCWSSRGACCCSEGPAGGSRQCSR